MTAKVNAKGDEVRKAKGDKQPKEVVMKLVGELKALKEEYESVIGEPFPNPNAKGGGGKGKGKAKGSGGGGGGKKGEGKQQPKKKKQQQQPKKQAKKAAAAAAAPEPAPAPAPAADTTNSPWTVSIKPTNGQWKLSIGKCYMPLPPTVAPAGTPAVGQTGYMPRPPCASGKGASAAAAASGDSQWHPDVLARFYVAAGMVVNVNRSGSWQPAKVLSAPKDQLGVWTVGDVGSSGGEWRETIAMEAIRPLDPPARAAARPAAGGAAASTAAESSGRWRLSVAKGEKGRYTIRLTPPSGGGGGEVGGLHEQCDALEARISKLESARGGDLRAVLAQEKQEAETLRAAIGEKEQTIAMKQQLNEEKKAAAELKKKIAAAAKPAKQPKQPKQAKQSGGVAADKLPPVQRPSPRPNLGCRSVDKKSWFRLRRLGSTRKTLRT